MKKFTHSLRALVALVFCLVGASAMAIDTVTLNGTTMSVTGTVKVAVDVPAETSYSAQTATFDLDAVLSILGISDITAADQYIVNATDGTCVENDGAVFYDGWRDWQGDAMTWSDLWNSPGGVCVKIDEPEEGLIDYIGCFDESWEVGDTYVAFWGFIAGDKVAIVEVDITFVEAEEVEATAVYAIEDIKVVNADNIPVCSTERYIGQSYNPTTCTIDIEGAAAALGLTEEELEDLIVYDGYASGLANIGENIYVAFNDDMGIAVDSLEWLYATDGWLLRSSEDWDGMAGDLTYECRAGDFGAAEYYIQETLYDPETHELSFYVGQYDTALQNEVAAETLKVGDTIYTYIYLMNAAAGATEAYVIKHNFVLIDMPSGGSPSEMNEVGHEDFDVTFYHTDGYLTQYIYPDTELAASLLGCSENEISLLALASADKFSVNSTANYGGWWFDETGYVGNWGSAPNYVEPYDYGVYNPLVVGTWGAVSDIGVYEIPLYMVYGENYYKLNITVNIIEKPEVDLDGCENVATTMLSMSQEWDDTYAWSEGIGINLTWLEAQLGTTSPDLYGVDTDGKYSDTYTCDPTPGFWLTSSGLVTSWGSDSYWGISVAVEPSDEELIFNFIQMPGYTTDGDVYTGTFYLVNLEEAKKVTLMLVYTIGEVVSYESAGSMDIILPLPTEAGDEADYAFKDALEEICEDLEVDIDYFADLVTVRGTAGYTIASSVSSGVYFDTNGFSVDPSEGQFFFCFDGYNLLIGTIEDLDLSTSISTQVVLECESTELSYTLNITFMSEDDYLPVTGVLADKAKSGAIYDLSGRQVSKAVKGVYIQDGKKVLVK